MCDKSQVISLRQPSPHYIILDLCGQISANFEQAFEHIIGNLHNLAVPHVVLNFDEVRVIDGSGLKQLLVFCTLMRKLNRKVAAYGIKPEVRRIFELTRMDNLLRTCENEFQALDFNE